jgi:hypothetical protein
MYHIISRDPKFDRDYISFIYEYLNRISWLDSLRSMTSVDDSYITDYDIFESVSDFACKNRVVDQIVVRSGGRHSSIKYYDLEFTPDHRFYYVMMKGWTFDLNKYVMSRFDGNWFRIPKNKYTLVR